MNALDQIDKQKLPHHIAIIMDGNGRWARKTGKTRIHGHRGGVRAVRAVSEACAELGVPFLTLYAFSTENWSRPRAEINALMTLLVGTIRAEIKTLHDNNIRLNAIGALDTLPRKCQKELRFAIENTSGNTRMTLTLALSYSARWELTESLKRIVREVSSGRISQKDLTEEMISSHLATAGIPDPELLIRTSGEHRISNFLLWQIAYAELYFTDTLWPDFTKDDLYAAIVDYQKRERRFGKTSEQLIQS
jgi:undecaprenyl diphosphate synthase